MRLTYTDLSNQFARNIGKSSFSALESTIQSDFKSNLGQRYQLVYGILSNYQSVLTQTATTVANQQYYHNPAGYISSDNCYITIGSVKYPLTTVYSQATWDKLNAIQIQASVIPQFIYPRANDFGVYPIPQDAYTITLAYYRRDRNLLVDDYLTGTITATSGSATIAGASTTFTAGMEGRWFTVTDTTASGQGYWYRVKTYNSPTSIDLETAWQGSTAATLTYRIGETPEIPEEGHIALVDGVTADFYSGARSDPTKSTWFENKFWTGNGNNAKRDAGDKEIFGGILGLKKRYDGRDNSHIIGSKPRLLPLQYKVFASSIS